MTQVFCAGCFAVLVSGCAAAEPQSGAGAGQLSNVQERGEVVLIPDGVIDPAQTAQPGRYEARLPEGTPQDVIDDLRGQLLAMMGREDIVAEGNKEFSMSECPTLTKDRAGEAAVFDEILERARETSIVIVNESHFVSRHRGFTRTLLERLKPLGYTVFAAETFANTNTLRRPIEQETERAYPRFDDGAYSIEPAFGRLIRAAKALNYNLVPYEQVEETDFSQDQFEQINTREIAQARNLADFLKRSGPDTRIIVHVGYMHASEAQGGRLKWMAARLQGNTGIDPLTIDQTICRGGGDVMRLSRTPADNRQGTYDLHVDHPLNFFRYGRPEWRFASGDRAIEIPKCLRPSGTAVIVEARPFGEPGNAVPMDRVYVRPGEDVRLALPPGRYRVRSVRTDI